MKQEVTPSYITYLKLSDHSSKTGNIDGTNYSLSSVEEVVIGREATCHIALDPERYPTVSRHHAKIQPFLNGAQVLWRICDLNAANGTYLNGNRLQGCQTLQAGDRITLSKDGPEFLFKCEIVSPSPAEIAQTESSELPPATEAITIGTTFFDASQSLQLSASPGAPPTQPVDSSPENVVDRSSRGLWNLVNEDNISVLVGHEDVVRTVAFSLDNKLLVSGSADKTIKIWDLLLRKEKQTLVGHKLAVISVVFNPDGQLIISGSADKTIKIWDVDSGESTQQLTGHGMGVSSLAASSDGRLLASGSADKTIRIWDIKHGEVQRTLSGHKMGVNAVAFHPSTQLLASGSADRTVKLWEIATGQETVTLPAFRSSINALFFSPDGEYLAISTDDKTVRLWNLNLKQEIRVLTGYNWQIGGLAISPDGSLFASGSEDKTVKTWKL